jgi:hypothetical protein
MHDRNSHFSTLTAILRLFSWPFVAIGDLLEIRRLRRRHPFVYRRLTQGPGGHQVETDEAYLDRLRDIDDERRPRVRA